MTYPIASDKPLHPTVKDFGPPLAKDLKIIHSPMPSSEEAREAFAAAGTTPRYWYSVDHRDCISRNGCMGWVFGKDNLTIANRVASYLKRDGVQIAPGARVYLVCQ